MLFVFGKKKVLLYEEDFETITNFKLSSEK